MPIDRLQDEAAPTLEEVLRTVSDDDARALIREMEEPRTAAELSEASDIPLSTTYRKIERLEAATLIDDLIEIRDDGRHTSRYYPDFETIEITLTDQMTMNIEISRPARTPDERLEDLWSSIREEV